jgi:hypothetical protein
MNIANGAFRFGVMPLCRGYAKYVLRDSPADAVYRFLSSLQFRRTHGFWPDFIRPRRFTEKLWSRMLHDRDPRLTVLCDKLGVRDYVKGKGCERYLIPLLWSGEDPDCIPFDALPPRYVIKTSHGCANNIFVGDGVAVDRAAVRRQLRRWLTFNYGTDFLLGIEWGYKHVPPAILIEEWLGRDGEVPADYKFYCFSGRAEVLTEHFGRFVKHETRSFDRDYKPHALRYHLDPYEGPCERPVHFEVMVQLAESLARDFDFLRVDLYNIDGRILFGELTPYPGGVSARFLPERVDYVLGDKWPFPPRLVPGS